MKLPAKPGRWIGGAIALLAAAAVAVPYLGADGFAAPIQQRLESALGRTVEINGRVRFQLLPRPGFSVSNVVIGENPELGVEPFAYVTNLEIAVGISSLWRRRLELASLRLDEPSINVMKAPDGPWNVQSLLDHAAEAGDGSPPPAIEVSGGRLNFKSGDLKSAYYLADADLLVETTGAGQLSLRFSGEPARTDRTARAFGRLSGRGSLSLSDGNRPSRIQLSLSLERTAVSEILTLVQGRGAGIGGFVTSRARLVGPLTNIDITGRLELDEFERWGWLLPGDAGRGLDFTGALDYRNQTLEIETRAPERASTPLPISVRLRATGLLRDTRWASTITLRGLPLASVRSLAEETGSGLPVGLPLEGALTGALSYSPAGGFRGQVRVEEASLALPGVPPLAFDDLNVIAEGTQLRLGPATVRVGTRHTARLEAGFAADSPALDVRLSSTGIQLAHLQAGWSRFTGAPLPPLLDAARDGSLQGSLRFVRSSNEAPPAWSGEIELSELELSVPGLAGPVSLDSAVLRLKGRDVSLNVSEGRYMELPFSAVFSRTLGEPAADRLTLEIPSVPLVTLEAALTPSLRRTRGFLARTLRLGSTHIPDWLAGRHLAATVHIGTLEASPFPLENVRASLGWEGPRIELRDFRSTAGKATLSGALTAGLQSAEPTWHGRVQIVNFPWREGRVEADAALDSSGLAAQFLTNLRLDGTFVLRDAVLPVDAEWSANSGCFTLSAGPDGRMGLELASAQQVRRLPAGDLLAAAK